MVSIKINSYIFIYELTKVSVKNFPHFFPCKYNSLHPIQLIIISHLLEHEYNFLRSNLITHAPSTMPVYSINLSTPLPLLQVQESHILETEAGGTGSLWEDFLI